MALEYTSGLVVLDLLPHRAAKDTHQFIKKSAYVHVKSNNILPAKKNQTIFDTVAHTSSTHERHGSRSATILYG